MVTEANLFSAPSPVPTISLPRPNQLLCSSSGFPANCEIRTATKARSERERVHSLFDMPSALPFQVPISDSDSRSWHWAAEPVNHGRQGGDNAAVQSYVELGESESF